MIHKAGLTSDERNIVTRMNKVRSLADQAEICASQCFAQSIGLVDPQNNGTFALKADQRKHSGKDKTGDFFSPAEATCIENCSYKLFITEQVMRAYLPTRMADLSLTQSELESRLNNPNKEQGPYFYTKEFEDS